MLRITTTTIILVGVIVVLAAALIYLWSTRSDKDGFGPQKPEQVQKPAPKAAPKPVLTGSTRVGANTDAPTLALFHAHWCPHCVQMMPEWKKVEKALDGKVETLELESKNPEMAKFDPKGFPTIRFYPKGTRDLKTFQEYNGPRTADAMIQFALSGGR